MKTKFRRVQANRKRFSYNEVAQRTTFNLKFCGEGRREGSFFFSERFWGNKMIETHKHFILPSFVNFTTK